jgi:hypothetical protein
MKMKKLFVKIVFLFVAVVMPGCSDGKRATADEALGGPVTVTLQDWQSSKNGYNNETNRSVELSYDLKKTIDNAKSLKWSCKCPIQDKMTLDGEFYCVFGKCKSQDGCQLIRRNDLYYLIKRKLEIHDK